MIIDECAQGSLLTKSHSRVACTKGHATYFKQSLQDFTILRFPEFRQIEGSCRKFSYFWPL